MIATAQALQALTREPALNELDMMAPQPKGLRGSAVNVFADSLYTLIVNDHSRRDVILYAENTAVANLHRLPAFCRLLGAGLHGQMIHHGCILLGHRMHLLILSNGPSGGFIETGLVREMHIVPKNEKDAERAREKAEENFAETINDIIGTIVAGMSGSERRRIAGIVHPLSPAAQGMALDILLRAREIGKLENAITKVADICTSCFCHQRSGMAGDPDFSDNRDIWQTCHEVLLGKEAKFEW